MRATTYAIVGASFAFEMEIKWNLCQIEHHRKMEMKFSSQRWMENFAPYPEMEMETQCAYLYYRQLYKRAKLSYVLRRTDSHFIRSTEWNSQCGFESKCTDQQPFQLNKSNPHFIRIHFIIFMSSDLICTTELPCFSSFVPPFHFDVLARAAFDPMPTGQLKSGADIVRIIGVGFVFIRAHCDNDHF